MFLFSHECINILAQYLGSDDRGKDRNLRINKSAQHHTRLCIFKLTHWVDNNFEIESKSLNSKKTGTLPRSTRLHD